MSKRAPLDLDQFKIVLPKPARDPLETLIPTSPVASPQTNTEPVKGKRNSRERTEVITTQISTRNSAKKERKHASKLAGYHASKQACYHDSTIKLLHKVIKLAGKEPFFGRFTPEEKTKLADISYTYKRSGIKTSESEIARIAVNFLIQDYEENGKDSLLDRVLKSLHT